ncbi:MAG: diacylglycerol kinase family protein [Crocinitomicaceae bacterium]|jgi:undecaprenol kinase|nr:diacylglycerol kinase family protein [Crocinitomicaceae bacterium]MDP4760005.1 diacylglycerol kinase family protein [Crocinitomicaceae bacterium]
MKHTNFFSSLKTAMVGIKTLFTESRNARIQFLLFTIALILGCLLKLTAHEWLWILVSATLVLSLEAVNTSMEVLADLHTTEYHPRIKLLKDISAAAVLIASIFSLIVALLVFWPHLSTILPD